MNDDIMKKIEVIDNIILKRMEQVDPNTMIYQKQLVSLLENKFFMFLFRPITLICFTFLSFFSIFNNYVALQNILFALTFSYMLINFKNFRILFKTNKLIKQNFKEIADNPISIDDKNLLIENKIHINNDNGGHITYQNLQQIKYHLILEKNKLTRKWYEW